MLQEKLKEATKNNHNDLEELMHVHSIMNGTLTLTEYKQILATNYIVHKRFEAALSNSLSPQLAETLDIGHRYKLTALERDMQELNIDAPDRLAEEGFELDKSDAAALGALYVLEGATLGGSVIVKRLKINPNINKLNLGFHYYQVYGENLIPNWKKFCEVLNQQPEESFDASIKSARQMFNYISAIQQLHVKQAFNLP